MTQSSGTMSLAIIVCFLSAALVTGLVAAQTTNPPLGAMYNSVPYLRGDLSIGWERSGEDLIEFELMSPLVANRYMAVAVAPIDSVQMARGLGVACVQPRSGAVTTTCQTITTSTSSAVQRTDDLDMAVVAASTNSTHAMVIVRVTASKMNIVNFSAPRRMIFAVGQWNNGVTRHLSSNRGSSTVMFLSQTPTTVPANGSGSGPTVVDPATTMMPGNGSSGNETTFPVGNETTVTSGGGGSGSGSSGATPAPGSSGGTTPSPGSGSGTNTPSPPSDPPTEEASTTAGGGDAISSTASEVAAAGTTSSAATTSEEATATTTRNVSTTTTTAAIPALAEPLSYAAEARARGVLTFCAALMSPVIGPSGVFDTTRALATFSFARCSHQSFSEVLDASTSAMPWPEALIPMQIGGRNNGHLRGTFVSNLFVVPLIFWICSVLYGFYVARQRPGKWQTPPGPPPTGKLGGFWLAYCEWMFYGSTLTALVVIFALGFDGAISALFMIFATSVETADSGGDFVLPMLYVIVVPIFLFRVANLIYTAAPSRYFVTPGVIKIKQGQKARQVLPQWAADFFGSKWAGWLVVGQHVWRPGSHKSYHAMRELAGIYRRFLGPDDDDRQVMALEVLEMHQEMKRKREEYLKAKGEAEVRAKKAAEEEAAKTAAADAAAAAIANEGERKKKEGEGETAADADAAAEKKNGDVPRAVASPKADANADDDDGFESKQKKGAGDTGNKKEEEPQEEEESSAVAEKKNKAQLAQSTTKGDATKKGYFASIRWGLQARRILYADFLFFEFIFVFFISMFKGLARVSMTPESCYSNAMGAAVFNLFFLIFLIAVRPFAVPLRNVLAIASSFFAMLGNFLATTQSGADAGVALSIFAAVFPFIIFVIIAVPRLLMRFLWGLQHTAGKQVALRDPTKPPPPPPTEEELRRQRELEVALSLKAAVDPKLLQDKNRNLLDGKEAALGGKEDPLLRNQEEEDAAAVLGIRRGADGSVGPLSQLAHMFFPPPRAALDKLSVATEDVLANDHDDDADSFGGFDDSENDDDLAYLDRMVYQKHNSHTMNNSNTSRSGSSPAFADSVGCGIGHAARNDVEMAERRLIRVHNELQVVNLQAEQMRQQQQPQTPHTPGASMTTQFIPQVYSPPRSFDVGTPLTAAPQPKNAASPLTRPVDHRIAQQTALAQLLVHIAGQRRADAARERDVSL